MNETFEIILYYNVDATVKHNHLIFYWEHQ